MGMWPENPALVLGRAYDVLAGNQLADALFDGFLHGANLVTKVFLEPAARPFYAEWEQAAANTVAGFPVLYGRYPGDPRIAEVLDAVLTRSEEFAALWDRHDARGKQLALRLLGHPGRHPRAPAELIDGHRGLPLRDLAGGSEGVSSQLTAFQRTLGLRGAAT
ncbi:MAG: DNA-binding protein [uncultured Nocardioides sp.]|uniref:DNA-binding protein n=2 Tax=uncultured Nocardioides sp. TaxID=198441 RepID=A0A6J4NXR7_9ACTN|nr:MAG: DNA-binding protein [uncultured Nocardioides sp.]